MRLARSVLLNPTFLTFSCSLKIKAVCIGIGNLILLMLLLSDPERSVNASSFCLESSGYQCEDGIKYT
jgi:hypothetical protein